MLPCGHSGSVSPPVSLAQYTIVMWYGTLASIPAGWVLCDGTLGTPDLRGYYIKGAASGNAGDNAAHGALTHVHDTDVSTQTGLTTVEGTGATVIRTAGHAHNVDVLSANHEPPYKHLVFIMKT